MILMRFTRFWTNRMYVVYGDDVGGVTFLSFVNDVALWCITRDMRTLCHMPCGLFSLFL
jgi:hypothetical protein